jgi:hypothetical protein
MQINSKNQAFLEGKISRGRCNSCAKGTGHTTSVYHICSLLNKQKPNEKQKKNHGKKGICSRAPKFEIDAPKEKQWASGA